MITYQGLHVEAWSYGRIGSSRCSQKRHHHVVNGVSCLRNKILLRMNKGLKLFTRCHIHCCQVFWSLTNLLLHISLCLFCCVFTAFLPSSFFLDFSSWCCCSYCNSLAKLFFVAGFSSIRNSLLLIFFIILFFLFIFFGNSFNFLSFDPVAHFKRILKWTSF